LVKSAYSFGDSIHVTFSDNGESINKDKNFQFTKIQPTIEDCFMLLSKN